MSETRLLSRDETTDLLRLALQARFPGARLSIRRRRLLGAAGLVVRWTDGPVLAEVEAVTRLYTGSAFQPESGALEPRESLVCRTGGELPEVVRFGVEVVLCTRRLSRGAEAALRAQCERWLGEPMDAGRAEHRRLAHLARAAIAFDEAGWPTAEPHDPRDPSAPATSAPAHPAAVSRAGIRPTRSSTG